MKPIANRRITRRKGQAALEYLTTYGFGLLMVLTTIGVINYLGFFNTNSLRSNICSFPTGFSCEDFIIHKPLASNGQIEVVLVNNYGVDVVVTDTTMVVKPSVNTAGIVCSPPTDTAGAALVPANTIAIGSKAVFLCEFGPTDTYVASQRYDGIIEIEFNQVGGAYPFTTTGVVSTVAQ